VPKRSGNCQKLVEKDQIYKVRKKSDSVFLTDKSPINKENSIWGGKFKIGCLRT
jgi:hypothetical protein